MKPISSSAYLWTPAQLNELLNILGEVTLLPVNGKRPTTFKGRCWGSFTIEDMKDPGYVDLLRRRGIGVAFGQRSNRLVGIDCDDDEFLASLLDHNSSLLDACPRSHGARGGTILMRMAGSYPKRIVNLTIEGKDVGEWRSDGGQSVMPGPGSIHPTTGKAYRWLNPEPVPAVPVIDFKSIVWPWDLDQRETLSNWTDDTEIQSGIGSVGCLATSVQSDTSVQLSGAPTSVQSPDLEALVRRYLPDRKGENHRLLFRLRQALKRFETAGQSVDYGAAFRIWWGSSQSYVKADLGYDAYLDEFDAAHLFKGADPVDVLLEVRTPDYRMPAEADMVVDHRYKELVALCHEMSAREKDGVFYLACRTVAQLWGLSSPETGAAWLRALVKRGILVVITAGGPKTNKASRYIYTQPATP